MKKIFYILSAFVLLGLASCNEPSLIEQPEIDSPLVDVYFNLQLPEAMETKAMSNTPQIESVWVVEFGAAGYFKRWAKAEPVSGHISTNGVEGAKTYRVELPISSAEQRFHIIAGYFAANEEPQTYTGQTELEVINSLETTGTRCAYWQRIIVPNGIRWQESSPGSGTYVVTPESQAYFNTIPLIRNFAKVIVYTKDSNFKILQYTLVDVPSKGKVAPYDPDLHTFVAGYGKDQISGLTFTSLYANGSGYKPLAVPITKTETAPASSAYKHPTDADPYLYLYERPLPTENPTCLLVQIQKGSATPLWYKIEILDNGKYVPIYRDFSYGINIGALDGDGEATAQDAIDGAAFGDVSASLETASLTSISDGNSTLTVDFTDETFMNNETSVDLGFTFDVEDDARLPKVTVSILNAASGAVSSSFTTYVKEGTATGSTVTGTATIPLTGISGSLKKSVLRVSGTTENYREVYRDVYIHVMGQQEFGGSVTGGSSLNDVVTLTITIPSDLGATLFPLTLFIEADDVSLSATDSDLPVQNGVSEFGTGKHTFWFAKTIPYTDYYHRADNTYTTSFTCHFKRNKNVSGTTTISVKDERDRFEVKEYTL